MKPEDATPEDLAKRGILHDIEESMKADFDRSRESETRAINEFEKILWLANSGAATVTIGYITTNENPSLLQFLGCSSFVSAIIAMMLMRFLAEVISSRDRARRQKASERFFNENLPLSTLGEIRDTTFKCLARIYKILKGGAALLFVVGCLLTLYGIYPHIVGTDTYNNGVQPTANASADS